MARGLGFNKTPEELEEEQRLVAEAYPELSTSSEDPTQKNRQLLKRILASTSTPLGKSAEESLAEENKPQFEMSPEIKKYGYDLFGMDKVAPSDVQVPFPVGQQPSLETGPKTSSESIESPVELKQPPRAGQQGREPASLPEEEPTAQPAKAEQPESAQLETQKPSDIESMIKASEEAEDRAGLWKQSAKMRDAIMGAGLGKILQTDTSLYEDLEKKAQRPMRNLLLKQELEDKKVKNDPNSSISKLMRKTLEDSGMSMAGLENVSYAQLEKIYPSLANTIATKLSAQARKEEASLLRAERADRKLDKLDQQKQKDLISHIDFSVNNLKKQYADYSKAQTTIDSIGNILSSAKNKITPGAQDVTLMYSFISNLDPASTVREGEIQLSKSAMSLWGKLKQGTAQLSGGDLLDPATRKSFEEIMKAIQAARQKNFAKQKANMIEAGVGKGLDKDMLNAYIYPEIDATSALKATNKQEMSTEEKLKQFEERLNKNQNRIEELKKKREM